MVPVLFFLILFEFFLFFFFSFYLNRLIDSGYFSVHWDSLDNFVIAKNKPLIRGHVTTSTLSINVIPFKPHDIPNGGWVTPKM